MNPKFNKTEKIPSPGGLRGEGNFLLGAERCGLFGKTDFGNFVFCPSTYIDNFFRDLFHDF